MSSRPLQIQLQSHSAVTAQRSVVRPPSSGSKDGPKEGHDLPPQRRSTDMPGYQVVHDELQDLRPERRRKLPGAGVQTLNDLDHVATDHEGEAEAEDSQGTIMLNNTSTLNANAETLFFEKAVVLQKAKNTPRKTRDTATETGLAVLGPDGNDGVAISGVGTVVASRKAKIKGKPQPQQYQQVKVQNLDFATQQIDEYNRAQQMRALNGAPGLHAAARGSMKSPNRLKNNRALANLARWQQPRSGLHHSPNPQSAGFGLGRSSGHSSTRQLDDQRTTTDQGRDPARSGAGSPAVSPKATAHVRVRGPPRPGRQGADSEAHGHLRSRKGTLHDSSGGALLQIRRESPSTSPQNELDDEGTATGDQREDGGSLEQSPTSINRRVQKLKVRPNQPAHVSATLSPIYERSVVTKVYKTKQAKPAHCHSPLLEVDETSRSTANLTQHDLQQMKQSQLRHAQVPEDQVSQTQHSPGRSKARVWPMQSSAAQASKTLQQVRTKHSQDGTAGPSQGSPRRGSQHSPGKIPTRAVSDERAERSTERAQAYQTDGRHGNGASKAGSGADKSQDDVDDDDGEAKVQLPVMHDDRAHKTLPAVEQKSPKPGIGSDQGGRTKKNAATRTNLSFPRDDDHFVNDEVKKINNRTDTFCKDNEDDSKSNNQMVQVMNLEDTLQREQSKHRQQIISNALISPAGGSGKDAGVNTGPGVNSGSDHRNARFGAKHFKNRQPYQTKVIEYAEYLGEELDDKGLLAKGTLPSSERKKFWQKSSTDVAEEYQPSMTTGEAVLVHGQLRGFKREQRTGKLIADARASMETMYLEEERTTPKRSTKRAFGVQGGRKYKGQPGQNQPALLDGVKGQLMDRSPRDSHLLSKRKDHKHRHQISGKYQLYNYGPGTKGSRSPGDDGYGGAADSGRRTSRMNSGFPRPGVRQESQSILSYQIDIKMGEASITEQSRLQAIREGPMRRDAGRRQAGVGIGAHGSQDQGTYCEGQYLDADLDIASNENITLYKDFAAARRTAKHVTGRRGSSCSSAGRDTQDNELRDHRGRNGSLGPHKALDARRRKHGSHVKRGAPHNTRSSLIPWQLKDADGDGGAASRHLGATNMSMLQVQAPDLTPLPTASPLSPAPRGYVPAQNATTFAGADYAAPHSSKPVLLQKADSMHNGSMTQPHAAQSYHQPGHVAYDLRGHLEGSSFGAMTALAQAQAANRSVLPSERGSQDQTIGFRETMKQHDGQVPNLPRQYTQALLMPNAAQTSTAGSRSHLQTLGLQQQQEGHRFMGAPGQTGIHNMDRRSTIPGPGGLALETTPARSSEYRLVGGASGRVLNKSTFEQYGERRPERTNGVPAQNANHEQRSSLGGGGSASGGIGKQHPRGARLSQSSLSVQNLSTRAKKMKSSSKRALQNRSNMSGYQRVSERSAGGQAFQRKRSGHLQSSKPEFGPKEESKPLIDLGAGGQFSTLPADFDRGQGSKTNRAMNNFIEKQMQKQRQFKERYQSALTKYTNMTPALATLSPGGANPNDLSGNQTLMQTMAQKLNQQRRPKGKQLQPQEQQPHHHKSYLDSVTQDIYLPQNLDKVTYQHQHSSSNRMTSFQNNTAKNATKIQLKLSELEKILVNSKTGVLRFPKTRNEGAEGKPKARRRKGSLPSPQRPQPEVVVEDEPTEGYDAQRVGENERQDGLSEAPGGGQLDDNATKQLVKVVSHNQKLHISVYPEIRSKSTFAGSPPPAGTGAYGNVRQGATLQPMSDSLQQQALRPPMQITSMTSKRDLSHTVDAHARALGGHPHEVGGLAPYSGQSQLINITDGDGNVFLVRGPGDRPELQSTILSLQSYMRQHNPQAHGATQPLQPVGPGGGAPTSLPLLHMNTINEEMPHQAAYAADSFSAATPIKAIGSGQGGHSPIDRISPMYQDIMDHQKNGMAYGSSAEPGQQNASHLQLPYINLAGVNYQMMQAAQVAGVGANGTEEGNGQQLPGGASVAAPYSQLGAYDGKGTPGGRAEAARKSLSRSPGKRRSNVTPAARRQQEIKGSLNQDLQIHQRTEKITSNDDIRQGMGLNAAAKAQAGHARGSKQAIQQILNNKSQQNAGVHLLHSSPNVRITVNQRRPAAHGKSRPQQQAHAHAFSKQYSLHHSPSITQDPQPAAQQHAGNDPKKQMNLTNQLSTYSNLPSYQIREEQKFGLHANIPTLYSGSIQSTQARFFSQKRRPGATHQHGGANFDKNSLQSALLSEAHGGVREKDMRHFKNNKLLF